MNYKKELIKKAFDSNAFISTDTEAVAVNPNIWDIKLRDYEEHNLVFTSQMQVFDFRSYGVDYTVTIDEEPTAAADVAETDAIAISAITTRNITFTPSERGAAYQTSRKEIVRAFFNVMENMSKKLGYKLARKKDALAISTTQSGAGNTVVVNDVASSAVASSDTLNYASITKAARLIEDDLYMPTKLFINPTQKQQLLDLGTINQADSFGTRDAIQKGLIGELFGLKIFVLNTIPTSANKAKAIVLGESQTGEQAVGYAIKRDPMMEQDYDPLYRQFTIVAHEEYDIQILHPNAIATIESYA